MTRHYQIEWRREFARRRVRALLREELYLLAPRNLTRPLFLHLRFEGLRSLARVPFGNIQ
jgi:hypothetical protein